MSSDPLEKNLGDLIRHGALPLDEKRTARAREHFLDSVAAPRERTSWKVASAAAALLVAVTIVWSAKTERPRTTPTRPESVEAGPVAFPGSGGDQNLQGTLQRLGDRLRFEGRSPYPDGVMFQIRVERLEIQEQDHVLQSDVKSSLPGSATLRKGAFEFEWPHKGPGKIRLLVSASDDLQDRSVAAQLRDKSGRQWTFEYCAWDEKLLGLLGPQLAELEGVADQARDLIGRVWVACSFGPGVETKPFIKEAERLQARADAMAASGLFPESSRRIGYTARDLAQAIPIFTWKEGKFDGPRSYYTNGEKSKTHRQEPFEFQALKKYLDEAELVAGREFGLWILAEFGRNGPRPALAETVKPHEKRRGLAEVAERLEKLVHEFHGVDLGKLDQDLRRLP